ncbi:hypothetical protein MRX96_032768 [Rhipicephalus microplus]
MEQPAAVCKLQGESRSDHSNARGGSREMLFSPPTARALFVTRTAQSRREAPRCGQADREKTGVTNGGGVQPQWVLGILRGQAYTHTAVYYKGATLSQVHKKSLAKR